MGRYVVRSAIRGADGKLQFMSDEEVQRAQGQVLRLAVSDLASVYGCCGLFDMCGDGDLMSLSFAGDEPLLDVIGWQPTNVCKIHKDFITYQRAERTEGGAATGDWLADPCDDPHGVEFGTCAFELENFGRLRRAGPVRDITQVALRLCENQPRYRLDGVAIGDDMEYGLRLATEVLLQGLKRLVITGNAATAGQFDGFEQLFTTGYTDPSGKACSIMDSIIVNWNGNSLAGGAGMTWNGNAIAATYNFVDVLLAVYRRIRDRIAMAPALGQVLRPGDIVFVAPTALIRCLLDSYTCWSLCVSSVTDTMEARRFRDALNGGMFGAGRIQLDGFEIPMLPYNWALVNSPTTFDAYLATVKVGNQRLIEGQFNDMRAIPNITGLPGGVKVATDGGRLLTWLNADQTCMQHLVEMQPRILAWAPWSTARFQDVVCTTPGGVLSPDPEETSFFPETSFEAAACPSP